MTPAETGPASTMASPDAELMIAAAFFTSPRADAEVLDRAQAIVGPEMFTNRALGVVYAVCARLREQGIQPDVVTVAEALKDAGTFDTAGGYDGLASLTDAVPNAAHVEQHAKIVREKAARRHWRASLQLALKDLEEGSASLGELLTAQRERVELLQQDHGGPAHILTLAEILADPDALRPPPPAVPRLAWAGRVTLLYAREKIGKSTVASAAVAAKTQGYRFLGETPDVGTVLYVGLEEHRGDLARRLVAFGAHPDRVLVLDRVGDPLADLENAVSATRPALTVVDTLATLVSSKDLDPGNASEWVPVMLRLARIARDSDTGLLVLHHARKADDDYRDSSAIGGGVDVLLQMQRGEVDGTRKFTAVGRWPMSDFTARLIEADEDRPAYFELAADALGVDAQVLAHISHHPGASSRQVRDAVRGRTQEVQAAVHRLLARGDIEDRGANGRLSLYLKAENPHGTATEPVGNHPGTVSGNHGAEVVPAGGLSSVGRAPREPHPETADEPLDILGAT